MVIIIQIILHIYTSKETTSTKHTNHGMNLEFNSTNNTTFYDYNEILNDQTQDWLPNLAVYLTVITTLALLILLYWFYTECKTGRKIARQILLSANHYGMQQQQNRW